MLSQTVYFLLNQTPCQMSRLSEGGVWGGGSPPDPPCLLTDLWFTWFWPFRYILSDERYLVAPCSVTPDLENNCEVRTCLLMSYVRSSVTDCLQNFSLWIKAKKNITHFRMYNFSAISSILVFFLDLLQGILIQKLYFILILQAFFTDPTDKITSNQLYWKQRGVYLIQTHLILLLISATYFYPNRCSSPGEAHCWTFPCYPETGDELRHGWSGISS